MTGFSVFSREVVEKYIRDFGREYSEIFKAALAEFKSVEVNALLKILEAQMFHASDPVRDLVEVNLGAIINLARAVKAQANSDFAGIFGRGNELTATRILPEMFKKVWGVSTTKWDYNVTSAGTIEYIGTEADPETTAEEEGIIILGFIDPVAESVITKAQIVKDNTRYQSADLCFNYSSGYPLAALPEPWVILPEQNFYIKVKAKDSGVTKLEPIGFKIQRAKNLLEL